MIETYNKLMTYFALKKLFKSLYQTALCSPYFNKTVKKEIEGKRMKMVSYKKKFLLNFTNLNFFLLQSKL